MGEPTQEILILQPVPKDHVSHPQGQGAIGAGTRLQVNLGPFGQRRPTGIHHDGRNLGRIEQKVMPLVGQPTLGGVCRPDQPAPGGGRRTPGGTEEIIVLLSQRQGGGDEAGAETTTRLGEIVRRSETVSEALKVRPDLLGETDNERDGLGAVTPLEPGQL
jgi:hypothetical protein